MAKTWLMLAAGDDRQHGGNDGYDDDPASIYRWDSTVPNHASISAGDAIVLWDKRAVIGASVIECIDESDAVKNVYRCVNCGKGHIKRRKKLRPAWRCFSCSTNFDAPLVEAKSVHTYASRHDVAWVDLNGVLDGAALRQVCESPRSQLSLRPLKWREFHEAVQARMGGSPLQLLESRGERLNGGHAQATVRVRLGQAAFRRRLLQEHGEVCALSGPTPVHTLEAGHLYSYAAVGEHHEDGGFLLRRDLHRLFDLGLITVDPVSQRINVRTDLLGYPLYAALDGLPLALNPTNRQRRWLRVHWELHRSADA